MHSCDFSVRDILTWVHFMNNTTPPLTVPEAFYHGAHLTLLDGLGCSGGIVSTDREDTLRATEAALQELLLENDCNVHLSDSAGTIFADDNKFGIHPFFIQKG